MEKYLFYRIFNLAEFEALDLVSKTYTIEFTDLGLQSFLVTKGNLISITYNGVMVSLNLNDHKPFEFEGYAIVQLDDGYVYLGIEKDEG